LAKLSAEQKKFLVEATSHYHKSLPGSPAAEYLETRGLAGPDVADKVRSFRLGYVDDPLPGHEHLQGMLAIPYLRYSPHSGWSVAAVRFRCIEEGCEHAGRHMGGKYVSMPGIEGKPHLFNTRALQLDTPTIAISEGEIDAITAEICGIPTVGVAGVHSWLPHFVDAFLGYETVFILADNDETKYNENCPKCKKKCRGHNPGLEFAYRLKEDLPNSTIIPSAKGHDVNSMYLEMGKKAILERVTQ
jgi:hypothetical protein